MGQRYSQISFVERRRIQDLRDAKVPVAAIAEELGGGFHPDVQLLS